MTPFQSPTEAMDPRCWYLNAGTSLSTKPADAAVFVPKRSLFWFIIFARYLPCCAAT